MGNEVRDSLVEDMLSIPPLCHKITRRRLLKATASISVDITLPLLMIMRVMDEEGTLHIAEIGERLQIPRPQMTHMIDKLVKMGIASRQDDPTDRRTINVVFTRNGKKVFEELHQAIKSSIKADLSDFTGEELQDLSLSLRKLRTLLSKM